MVHADYALQVSDRLVTVKDEGRYEPLDPVANKAVVLLARDGLISMAYAGTAHIANAVTDGWIARTLAGRPLGTNQVRPNFGHQLGRGVPDRFLTEHLTLVADRLSEALKSGKITNTLAIDYVGLRWQNPKDPAWPTVGKIAKDQSGGAYRAVMSRRRWGWESGRHFLFRALGRSQKKAQALLRSRLPDAIRSKEQTAAALVEILRSLPPHDPTVGRDCLITTIQRGSPHVHTRYEPYDVRQASALLGGNTVTVPAAFTPWILTPDSIGAPLVISGTFTQQSGGFEFLMEGPTSEGDFIIMSSQPRLPPPSMRDGIGLRSWMRPGHGRPIAP